MKIRYRVRQEINTTDNVKFKANDIAPFQSLCSPVYSTMQKEEGFGTTNPSFLHSIYDIEYYPLLDFRRDSFRRVFESLEGNFGRGRDVVIVETGTTSNDKNWPFSGQSTLLFDRYLNYQGNEGRLYSVDLDASSCEISRSMTSVKVDVHTGDSVERLLELNDRFVRGE